MAEDDIDAIKERYKALGFETQRQSDKPGTIYKPHRHGETRIYTLKGSAKVKLEGEPWRTFGPDDELIIKDNQLHEAIIGKETWEYIFAASPEEMKRQGLL